MQLKQTLEQHYITREELDAELARRLADQKSASISKGLFLIVGGIGIAFGFPAAVLLVTKQEPGAALLGYSAPFATLGVTMVIRGANKMSGEALDIQANQGGWRGGLAKLIRGRNGS